MTKEEARALGRARAPSDPEDRARRSAILCARLLAQPDLADARQIGLFSPCPWEPDLLPLLAAFPGKCFFPATDRTANTMQYFLIDAVDELVSRPISAAKSLREPDPARAKRAMPWNEQDLILVPGSVFDWSGSRVGSGFGYYDRFLAGLKARCWGVVFAEQLVIDALPHEPWDIRVSGVFTDRGFIATKSPLG